MMMILLYDANFIISMPLIYKVAQETQNTCSEPVVRVQQWDCEENSCLNSAEDDVRACKEWSWLSLPAWHCSTASLHFPRKLLALLWTSELHNHSEASEGRDKKGEDGERQNEANPDEETKKGEKKSGFLCRSLVFFYWNHNEWAVSNYLL